MVEIGDKATCMYCGEEIEWNYNPDPHSIVVAEWHHRNKSYFCIECFSCGYKGSNADWIRSGTDAGQLQCGKCKAIGDHQIHSCYPKDY